MLTATPAASPLPRAAVLALAIGLVAAFRVVPLSSDAVRRFGIASFLEEAVTWRGFAAGLAERGLLVAGPPTDAQQRRPLVVFSWIDAARIAEALGSRATVAVFDKDPRGFAFQRVGMNGEARVTP